MNQNELDWYAARLAIAVEETRRLTPEMGVYELKAALSDIPGIETLTVGRADNGNQILTVGDKSVEVGPMASVDEIRLALQNPFIRTENTKMSVNPIDRIKEKLAKAAGVGGRVAANIEAKADALIARESVLEAKTAQAFAGHEAIADHAHSELDAIEGALNQLSNGGPALND